MPRPAAAALAKVEDLDHRGRGVARVEGRVAFIEGALPGETVRWQPRRRRRSYDEGHLLEVLEPSPERTEPRCPHFDLCGGCSLQHLDHGAQLARRQASLLEDLRHIGRVEPDAVAAPIAAAPWGYRRRARFGARHVPAKGGVLVGFRERRTGRVAVLEGCEVLVPELGSRLPALRELLGSLDARARIPQIEAAAGDDGLTLVVRHLDPLSAEDRCRLEDFARGEGLRVLVQPGGPETATALWPPAPTRLHYRLDAFDLEIGFEPTDFIQVNAAVNAALVGRVVEWLAPGPEDRVLDLFCGVGNFSLPLARRAGAVVGVEGSPDLVSRARDNAIDNGIDNASFAVADLDRPRALAAVAPGPFDRLLLDPPRGGAAAFLDDPGEALAPVVVYVSCNPATLARDLGVLVNRHGYRLTTAGVVDMFAHTAHVESVARLVRE